MPQQFGTGGQTMSEEKQIEEMAVENLVAFLWHNTSMYDEDQIFDVAEALVNEGYRKQSEVIDEFAERLMEAPIKCGLPLFGLSTKGEIEAYFHEIMLQVRDAINNTAKEMKGEGR
jgi:hypothetical protein